MEGTVEGKCFEFIQNTGDALTAPLQTLTREGFHNVKPWPKDWVGVFEVRRSVLRRINGNVAFAVINKK